MGGARKVVLCHFVDNEFFGPVQGKVEFGHVVESRKESPAKIHQNVVAVSQICLRHCDADGVRS